MSEESIKILKDLYQEAKDNRVEYSPRGALAGRWAGFLEGIKAAIYLLEMNLVKEGRTHNQKGKPS